MKTAKACQCKLHWKFQSHIWKNEPEGKPNNRKSDRKETGNLNRKPIQYAHRLSKKWSDS
jgi:hypothetical protein